MKNIALLLLFLVPSVSFACKCEPSSTDPSSAFKKHEIVALIKVCEAHLETVDQRIVVMASGVTLDTLKGVAPDKVLINVGDPNSNCHQTVAVGRDYLIFANKAGQAYLGYCQPSGEPHRVGYEYMRSIKHKSSNKVVNADC